MMDFKSLERDFYSIKSLELQYYSAQQRANYPSRESWGDYAFLAACFIARCGDISAAVRIAEEIKVVFPDYDPLRRFSWTSAVGSQEIDELFYTKFDLMALFRNSNPNFKFETVFGDLFTFDIEHYEDFYK